MGHKIGQENRTKKIGQKIGHEQVGQNKSEKNGTKESDKENRTCRSRTKKSDIENRIIIGQKNRKKVGQEQVGQKNRAKIGHEIGQTIGHINRHE